MNNSDVRDNTVTVSWETNALGQVTSESTRIDDVGLVSFEHSNNPLKYFNPKDAFGWRQPSPYSRNFEFWKNWSGSYSFDSVYKTSANSYRERTSPYPQVGTLEAFNRSSLDFTTEQLSLIARAEVECLNKIKGQKVNLAVGLATAKQSISMIALSLSRFGTALSSARRGRWSSVLNDLGIPSHRFKRGSKDASGRWLELQYGWLPLLSDAHGYYQEAQRAFVRNGYAVSATKTVRSSYENDFSEGDPVCKYSDTVSYGVKVRLDYLLMDDGLSSAAMLGLTNPATVAWELVPWSFVVDWVLPIGNWLDAMDATLGLSFLGGSRTLFMQHHRSGTCTQVKILDRGRYVDTYNYAFSGGYDRVSFTRAVYTKTPFPSLYFKSPVSVGHALNAVALIRGLFK